jgi:hypothetical protein
VIPPPTGSGPGGGFYLLTTVNAYNPFAPTGTSVVSGPIGTSGVASVDSAGNVYATGIQNSFVNVNSAYNYTNGTWSAVVGGDAVTHTETCTESASTPCTSAVSGLSGIWNSTQRNGGAASHTCAATAFFAAGNCDRVSIVEVAGVSLTIIEQSEFAIPGLAAGNIWRFSGGIIPVPGAVWLFGSALWVMGWMRRKSS